MLHIEDRCDSYELLHVFFEKFRVSHQSNEHLSGALAMANIGYLFLTCFFQDKLPQSRLIIYRHFMKAVFPEFFSAFLQLFTNIKPQFKAPMFDIKILVFLGVPISP